MSLSKFFVAVSVSVLFSSTFCNAKDFIFSENPELQNVRLQKVNFLFPSRLMASKGVYGETVAMDDGSVWRIDDPTSALTVQSWYINDSLIVCSNIPSYQGAPRFFIYNQMTKTSAFAEPSIKPVSGKVTSNSILWIDYNTRHMQTTDGVGRVSYWLVDYNDFQKLQRWQPTELIVIGYNQNYHTRPGSSLPYVLINMDKNSFVYAQLQ